MGNRHRAGGESVRQSIRESWVVGSALSWVEHLPGHRRRCRSTSIDGALWFIAVRYDQLDRRPALMYFTATSLPSRRTRQAARRGCLSSDNDDLRWFLPSWWESTAVGRRGLPLNTERWNEFALTAAGFVASAVTLNRLRYSAPTAATSSRHDSHRDHTIHVHITADRWRAESPSEPQVATELVSGNKHGQTPCSCFSRSPGTVTQPRPLML